MAKNTANYGNDSIRQLKDEERVRLRPAVIFGSDGLDGCAHAAAFADERRVVDEMLHGWMLLCREVVSIIAQTRAIVAECAILFVDLRYAITQNCGREQFCVIECAWY